MLFTSSGWELPPSTTIFLTMVESQGGLPSGRCEELGGSRVAWRRRGDAAMRVRGGLCTAGRHARGTDNGKGRNMVVVTRGQHNTPLGCRAAGKLAGLSSKGSVSGSVASNPVRVAEWLAVVGGLQREFVALFFFHRLFFLPGGGQCRSRRGVAAAAAGRACGSELRLRCAVVRRKQRNSRSRSGGRAAEGAGGRRWGRAGCRETRGRWQGKSGPMTNFNGGEAVGMWLVSSWNGQRRRRKSCPRHAPRTNPETTTGNTGPACWRWRRVPVLWRVVGAIWELQPFPRADWLVKLCLLWQTMSRVA